MDALDVVNNLPPHPRPYVVKQSEGLFFASLQLPN